MTWINEQERQSIIRSIRPIHTKDPPSQILAEDFPMDCGSLPIAGGWGYTTQDAFVFLRHPDGRRYDFIALEYLLVQKRTYEELIIFRPQGEQFSGIQFETKQQALIERNGRQYDRLQVRIQAWPDRYWEALKAEWESAENGRKSGLDIGAHARKRDAAKITLDREFWFDISDVMG